MLDVHPPEHTPHTWRDFFIHIATIVLGLLIAIGLEQTVEYLHHLHQAREARDRIHTEVEVNQRICQEDLRQIDSFIAHLRQNLAVIDSPAAKGSAISPALDFELQSQGFYSAALNSARDSGALARLPYDESAMYSDAYLEGDHTTEAVFGAFKKAYAAKSILRDRPLSALSPAEIQSLSAATAAALGQAEFLKLNLEISQQEWDAVRTERFRNDIGATLK
jgi:hypothetical protein